MKIYIRYLIILFLFNGILACNTNVEHDKRTIKDLAANKDVESYMDAFKGLGALTDSTQPTLPSKALEHFQYSKDLALDLVLSEPAIMQPVELSFDHQGRLWVVQYNQYPYPKGLKVESIDNFLRVKFDKTPAPPPKGIKGADKITVFEDTDGDGRFEKSTDVITGLNMVTSVTLGRGNIWVLNPPYLLAYADPDGDGFPDGDPVVHLRGFGLEDTHAVANSLQWGPDGWLYGGQGSTSTANISSAVSKNISFQGQAIWRYNTETKVFEVFSEGGGNTFNVEFDGKGHLFSGNNGSDRGPNFKQGAYYPKSLGKHGPYTNKYAFGNLSNMELQGDTRRFTHSLIRYEGGSFPSRYNGKFIALNPLLNYVQITRLESKGSTFRNVDEDRILETDDHWFRPVDLKSGPDGSVYIADWYDSRLSHVDPRDTWHKSSGRIYRLRNKNRPVSFKKFDLSKYSSEQLVELLKSNNKWFRQQALIQFGNSKDRSIIPKLVGLLESKDNPSSLEALWAINIINRLDDRTTTLALQHKNSYVRLWGVRLLGDTKRVSSTISSQLGKLASFETDPEVRSQLASTAKRLPGLDAIQILRGLLKNHDDSKDPDIPLLIWWAIESKSETDRDLIVDMFEDKSIWQKNVVKTVILKRLMQRYIMAGGDENYNSAARLIKLSPSKDLSKVLISGLNEGLRGRDILELSPELMRAIQPFQSSFFGGPLALGIQKKDVKAVNQALNIIVDDNSSIDHRRTYIKLMGQTDLPQSVPALLKVVESSKSSAALKETALQSLERYNMNEIGVRVASIYPQMRGDLGVREAAMDLFASRRNWARELLSSIENTKKISKNDVTEQVARRLKLLNDPMITKSVERIWPNLKLVASSEKNTMIAKYIKIIRSGEGDSKRGRVLFLRSCGGCHRLFKEGGDIGPDLTGYERRNINSMLLNIIDPNADIREGYVIHRVTTTDGRSLEGKILARNGDSFTLQSLNGKEITLSSKQIKEMKAQQISTMPERILDSLTEQEVKDIFSYIMK
ncbi:MAG TPA: c-type cytochrome [Daejeonella sp.]|uniref:DUF7133 domain-containing protein n=1 Tax=Daejeonella sp. TaxID=2805397 RepID=UPI002EDB4193